MATSGMHGAVGPPSFATERPACARAPTRPWQGVAAELGSHLQAMLGLISTPDPRYRGGPDPDEERERRWEPINWRISEYTTLSLLCRIDRGSPPLAALVLVNLGAIALCAYAAPLECPPRRLDETDDAACSGLRP